MERYICRCCGREFDLPALRFEDSGPREGPRQRRPVRVSPCCLAPYVEGKSCAVCGRLLPPEELEDGLCPRCARETVDRFRGLLRSRFSPEERAVLDRVYDGASLAEAGERGDKHEQL